jgi:gamma-glutamylcyclotransferase (GGCT)/AIG2-like uncharacterized protein YtfP
MPIAESTTLVAVYGTLRQGRRWNYLLAESLYLGLGWTEERFALYLAEYPCVDPHQEVSPIRVDVYQVSSETLACLDELEEHPLVYVREEITVLLDQIGDRVNEPVKAWLYFYPHATGRLIAHGDYALEYNSPSPGDASELLGLPLTTSLDISLGKSQT